MKTPPNGDGHSHTDGYAQRRPAATDPMPPYNPEVERRLIGSMILDAAIIDDVSEIIEAEDFFVADHENVYHVVKNMHGRGELVNSLTVDDELRRLGIFDHARSLEFLRDAVGSVSHASDGPHYASIVREKAKTRALIEAANETLREAYLGLSPAREMIDRAEARFFAIGHSRSLSQTVRLSTALDETMARIQARAEGHIFGVPTGFPDLDAALGGGLPNGSLTIVAARPSMGKAQPLNAKVLTPSGFVTMGSLAIGDLVIGSDGLPHPVTGIFPQGYKHVFRVTMSDGTSTECCNEHLWFTQTRAEKRRGCPGSVKSLGAIRDTLTIEDGARSNHRLPEIGAVVFNPRPEPRLDPYLLGLLLGDGTSHSNVILHNPEPDLQEAFASLVPASDAVSVSDGITCRVSRARRNNDRSSTKHALSSYGLDGKRSFEKFVPDDYLYGTPDCRLATLQGLVDTDGYVVDSGQSVEYITTSERLANDVAFLVRSLGGIVSCRKKTPTYRYNGERRRGRIAFRMNLWFPNGIVPVRSSKHLARWKHGDNRFCHRSIVSVERTIPQVCQCIRIDSPDHIYITDEFIPTHNTAWALDVCAHAAFEDDTPALIFSLEMNRIELCERLISGRARVNSNILKETRYLVGESRESVMRASGEMYSKPLLLNDQAGISVSSIAAEARRQKSANNIGLIVVDYVQLIQADEVSRKGTNRQEQVSQISRSLKVLAKQLDVPVLAMSQLNRQSEAKEDKRPLMSGLRESGSLEQDADIVLLLHRPDYYDANEQPGVAELIIAKNRNGGTGTIKLAFLRQFARFESLDCRRAAGGEF